MTGEPFKRKSLIQTAREAKANKAAKTPQEPLKPKPAPNPPKPPEKPAGAILGASQSLIPVKKGSPPVVSIEKVTAQCGHTVDFPIFPDPKDRFRDKRKLKYTDRPCPDCRAKQHTELEKKQAADKAKRDLKKTQNGEVHHSKGPKKKKQGCRDQVRFPHGSEFVDVVYDAVEVKWRCTLRIGLVDAGGPTFSIDGKGIHALLVKLGWKYRFWIKEQEKLGTMLPQFYPANLQQYQDNQKALEKEKQKADKNNLTENSV